ncbi:MAG TPA: tRNA 2-selenouridine(34) synthase MnmH [Clostridia bacterium]|nr:tRNA 2-selenouridine(34) synthase MnmH [Clostridia bacterium]
MYKNINITELFELPDVVLVDARSEGEYNSDTIPGSVNIPLLSNEERKRVGICYKNEGPEQAKRLGLEIVSPKLVWMVNAYDQIANGRRLVVFCWRGGLRSKFTASLLAAMGFNAYRLIGGYKAYRRYVYNYLDCDVLPHRPVVLYGLTGVGKTTVIERLIRMGIPAVDLEGIAKHRGSVFGKIGLPPSPTQKKFESLIVDSLTKHKSEGYFVIECESKRIGNLIVPDSLMNSMGVSYRVLMYAPLEVRVQRIVKEYNLGFNNIAALQESVYHLKKKLGGVKVKELITDLGNGKVEEVFRYLIEKYYDRLYGYPGGESGDYDLCIDTTDLDQAVDKVYNFVKTISYRKNQYTGG